MSGNIGETQETTTGSYTQAASTPGLQLHIPFIPRSTGSYTQSNALNCANGSNANYSAIPQSSGSSKSSFKVGSPITSENGIPFVSALSESRTINNTTNAGSPSLLRSSGSYTRNIQANFSSILEGGVSSLPRSSGSCTRSCTKSNSSSPGNICRICHDGELEEKLVSPCRCAGTQGLIHKTCLERWLSTASYDNCELCHFPFHLKKKPKSFIEFLCHKWEPDMRRAITGDLLCFLVLTPLTLVSAYLCGRGAIQYFTDRDYYDNRIRGTDQDLSLFSSPFSKRYRDRQIPREQLTFKTSIGATYVENENENKIGLPDDNETEPLYMEASGLIVLAVMLVVIYSCWLAIAVRYHVKAFRRWQLFHQDLVLVDVSNPGPIFRLNLSFMSDNSPPNRTEPLQIYTLPESSCVDLDEQREHRMSIVPEVHNESRRSSIFSPSNNISVMDIGRSKSNSRVRSISECIRRLSESDEQREQTQSLVPQVHNEIRRSSMFSPSISSIVRKCNSTDRRASESIRSLSECIRRLSESDKEWEQRILFVPQVYNESLRSSMFSPSKNNSVMDSGRRKSNSTDRIASECIRRLSESGQKSNTLVGRRASKDERRSSIFSGCLNRENSPTRCLMYEELSGKALLDNSKNRSNKRYGTVDSLDGSPTKKYFEENIHYEKSKSPTKTYNGATWIDIEQTKPSKAVINTLLTKKKVKTSISPVAPEVSIPIHLEDYESPESYRIACAMYAEAMYNEKLHQIMYNGKIHQFPFSPSRFNKNRRDSTRSTHL